MKELRIDYLDRGIWVGTYDDDDGLKFIYSKNKKSNRLSNFMHELFWIARERKMEVALSPMAKVVISLEQPIKTHIGVISKWVQEFELSKDPDYADLN